MYASKAGFAGSCPAPGLAVALALAVGLTLGLVTATALADARQDCDRHAADASRDVLARQSLAVCYLLGRGRLTDHAEALALFESAAAEGSDDARFALAAALLFKVEDTARDAEAVSALQSLVAKGYVAAHFPLAVAHAAALGTEENRTLATKHFANAASGGDEVAAWVLAVSHRFGLLDLEATADLGYQYAGRYLALLGEQYPDLVMTPAKLREAVWALHHDRLLRRFVFSDAQLELFSVLAEELIAREDLAALREGWVDAGGS